LTAYFGHADGYKDSLLYDASSSAGVANFTKQLNWTESSDNVMLFYCMPYSGDCWIDAFSAQSVNQEACTFIQGSDVSFITSCVLETGCLAVESLRIRSSRISIALSLRSLQ